MIRAFVLFWSLLAGAGAMANAPAYPLETPDTQLCDQASLQRGAALFVNYCMGCHSLQYVRYNSLAKGIGLVDTQGVVLDQMIKEHLNFVTDKVTDPMVIAMSPVSAADWFGAPPPDLSLVARVRGKAWIYTYLKSFYQDDSRPFGVNNAVFPQVGMPHVLVNLQGIQKPVFAQDGHTIVGFTLDKPGTLTPAQYDQVASDLANFLDYVGEPVKLERKRLGGWVLLFSVVFLVFAYLLKREYWKDVHKPKH